MTDWRRLLGVVDGYEVHPGAGAGELAAAEAALDVVFPEDLRVLYLSSDGVFDAVGQWFVIWPLVEVVSRNQAAWSRDAGPARGTLVGFGDDGTGDPFCVARDGDAGVFAWSEITGEATRLSDTVADFWSGWVAGTLPPH